MEQFIYTNPQGRSITFANSGNYIISDYKGLSVSEVIPVSSRGFRQVGQTLSHTSMGIRIIKLDFYLHDTTLEGFYEKRRAMAAIFNPLLGEGKLIYSNNHITKQISVIPTVQPQAIQKLGTLQQFSLELTAHNPLWYDIQENRIRMGGFENGLTYPIEEELYQFADATSTTIINNVGDWITSVKFEFAGEATNPKITNNTTGEHIEVLKVMSPNEKLFIDTAYGNKTVIFQNAAGAQSSAYNLISNDSVFFQLGLGANSLSFSAEVGQPEIYISWRNCYVGV